MRVKWTEHALMHRNQVADYIRLRFGAKRKVLFLQEVRQVTQLLKRNPNMGAIDPLFAIRPIAYRSVIINGLSKMVYQVDGNLIIIVAFWDTRSEPKAQAAQVSS